MKILLVDNYDSFTFNLAHEIRSFEDIQLVIAENDLVTDQQIDQADKLIISPGPGVPGMNGRISEIILSFAGRKPILGVCLGMQAICEAFGGSLTQLPKVHHGVRSIINIIDAHDLLFQGIPNPFMAGRYHSWVCDPLHFPGELAVSATDDHGTFMACYHRTMPVHGIQFHPESFLTPFGKKILENFIRLV